MNPLKTIKLVCLTIAVTGSIALGQTPLSNAFTYQGRLDQSGSPLNASADLRFRLFPGETTGTVIGTVVVSNVNVVNGLFTASLDFGAQTFTGDARWLEIAVRSPAGSGTFTTLTPRQPLSAAPYALYALTAGGSGPWSPSGSNIFNTNTGNVGIGTTTPTSRLHVAATVPVLNLQDTDSTTQQVGYVGFRDSTGSENGWVGFGSSGNAHAHLMNNRAGGNTALGAGGLERLTVTPSGNVGIGTTAPIAGLHVTKEAIPPGGTLALEGATHTYMTFFPDGAAAGRKGFFGFASAASNDISLFNEVAGGNIVLFTHSGGVTKVNVLEITGADLAEKFPTTDLNVAPGTVMEIDTDHPGQLRVARTPYSSQVAGVVSGAGDLPVGAVLGNLPGKEKAPAIALSGRVWVLCDASEYPIAPGNLLTTSATPGHAMKAADRERSHGAVLGKAMTGLERGRGLVLVLVSLQ